VNRHHLLYIYTYILRREIVIFLFLFHFFFRDGKSLPGGPESPSLPEKEIILKRK